MRIVVDEKLCELHGQCVFLAADLFEIIDDELVYKETLEPEELERAQKAVKHCPQLAIRIVD